MADFRATFEAVRPRLQLVERFIGERIAQGPQPVREVASYVLDAGGKRLRPGLLIVVAQALGYRGDRDVEYAAIVEMIHTATLVHDDIIDHSSMRRGRATANHRWGNQFAVLLGDWLYMKAIELAVELDDIEAMRALSSVTAQMTEGEIMGLLQHGRATVTLDEYFEIARRKTAELFAAAASLPACFAPGFAQYRGALERYGRNLGVCFQIVDDLLDVTGLQQNLGKPVFSDLQEGKMTLPFILLRERGGSRERALIEGVLGSGEIGDGVADELRHSLEHYDVPAATVEIARRYGNAASEALDTLPASTERDALALAPSYVIERES